VSVTSVPIAPPRDKLGRLDTAVGTNVVPRHRGSADRPAAGGRHASRPRLGCGRLIASGNRFRPADCAHLAEGAGRRSGGRSSPDTTASGTFAAHLTPMSIICSRSPTV